MKTIFRVAALGLVIAAFGAASTFAQATPCTFEQQQKLYGDYKSKTSSKISDFMVIRTGIKSGEEFLAKCADPGQQVVVDYLKTNIPVQVARADKLERYKRFNDSTADIKTLNVDDAYSSGKAIAASEPNLALDVGIALALAGYYNSIKTPPVDRYNVEAINFAKKAISDLESGKTSENYGANAMSRVVKVNGVVDNAKSRNNTLAWMNYVIGSIMYFNQKSEKDSLPFFYKAVQIDSDVKKRPDVYQAIGGWYLSEIIKMEAKRQELIKANNNEDTPESLALLASMKGYAERGINALAKAHELASSPAQADYKKGLYTKLQGLYEVRFGKTEGVNDFIKKANDLTLADPATPVAPVVEAPTTTPSTTTPTNSTTNDTTKPATTTPVNPKPATTNPTTTNPTTKPATTTPIKPAAKTTGGKVNTTKSKAEVNKNKGTK